MDRQTKINEAFQHLSTAQWCLIRGKLELARSNMELADDCIGDVSAIDNATPKLPTSPPPTPFVLKWDGHGCAVLRKQGGYNVVAFMGERTYKRIKQAKEQGADFHTLVEMFPQKRTVYNA